MTSHPARPPFAIEIGDLVARLADRAPWLARDLLPGGVRRGTEWCVAAADSGPLGCSISVKLAGDKAGVWGAWAAGKGGDALDLIAVVKCHGDKADAIRWALDWLRIDPSQRSQADEPAGKNTPAKTVAEPTAEAKRAAAFRLWITGTPLRPGDATWDYLAGRGIDLAALPRLPAALRCYRELTNIEAGRKFPALVAGVYRHGKFLTVHRTFLERQSDGRVLKAPVDEPKKVFGPYKGGLIPIARGASGRPWKDPSPDDTLGLAEGIENALTYALAKPEHRVAAAINVGNLVSLDLHPAIRRVILAADSDAPGSQAEQTLQRAVGRFLAEGREVRIARCPPGIKDLNELLLQGSAD